MADHRPADASGQTAAPMTRRERREAERRAARAAAGGAGTGPATSATGGTPAGAVSPAASPAEAPRRGPVEPTQPVPTAALAAADAGASGAAADDAPPAEETASEPAPRVADGHVPDPTVPLPPGGRNVPVAIAVGLGLGLAVVASLFFWRKEAFLGIVVLACGIGLWELSRAVGVRDIRLPLLPLLVGTVGMVISAYTAGVEALLVACVLTAGGAFVWRVLDGGGIPALRDATAAVFATGYVPFLAGFVALMLAADDGPWRVLAFIAICVSNDVGGYAAGVMFGRTRMAPIVSPKKSWEGLIGSFVLASAVGVGLMLGPLGGPWWAGLALGAAGVLAATLGDLAESLLKRDLGVKDMGTLLPGHGGVLDRVDSVLFAAPVAFLLLHLVLGSGR
ncbi:phosphatidate cytidylyltransferase [Actinotalea caeni]